MEALNEEPTPSKTIVAALDNPPPTKQTPTANATTDETTTSVDQQVDVPFGEHEHNVKLSSISSPFPPSQSKQE